MTVRLMQFATSWSLRPRFVEVPVNWHVLALDTVHDESCDRGAEDLAGRWRNSVCRNACVFIKIRTHDIVVSNVLHMYDVVIKSSGDPLARKSVEIDSTLQQRQATHGPCC
jgi:hypothetical protein